MNRKFAKYACEKCGAKRIKKADKCEACAVKVVKPKAEPKPKKIKE